MHLGVTWAAMIDGMRSLDCCGAALLLAFGSVGQDDGVVGRREELERRIRSLVDELRGLGIDPASDDLGELLDKRATAEDMVERFAAGLLSEMGRTEHVGIDYVRFLVAAAPRLSGRIVTVGEGRDFADLATATIAPGDTVVLAPGEHQLPARSEFRDVAFVGRDATQVVLKGQIGSAQRVRVEHVTVDCDDDPFVDLRRGGSVHLRDCAVGNYNSGAGGSNAMFASGGVLLIESSRFDGSEGRAKAPGRFGDAFDFRGRYALYARGCQFVDNDEILRATSQSTFDRCTAVGGDFGVMPYPTGQVFTLGCQGLLRRGATSIEFELSTDSREVIDHLMDPDVEIDARTAKAAEALGLDHDLRYWGALLRHRDPEVRAGAIGRISSLLRRQLPKFELDLGDVEALPEPLRARFADDVRSGHFLDWLERERRGLVYDPDLGHYRAK